MLKGKRFLSLFLIMTMLLSTGFGTAASAETIENPMEEQSLTDQEVSSETEASQAEETAMISETETAETEIPETAEGETEETVTEETETEETKAEETTEAETEIPESEEETTQEETEAMEEATDMEVQELVSYRSHVQNYGWMDWVSDGALCGTSGEALRMEAMEMKLGSELEGGIEYRAHVQTIGWQDWVSDGETAGTTGMGKRMEAINIRLTGAAKEQYDVYYRVHVQKLGWLGWAKNGGNAGTSGFAYRAEAVEVVLVEKGGEAPGPTEDAYVYKRDVRVKYRVHMQTYGWMNACYDGETAGIPEGEKRMEALRLFMENKQGLPGGVEYQVHAQTYGWMSWQKDGANAGTEGQSKRLEAVKIRLYGMLANSYDIYYRCCIETFGWTGWAKNGEECGSQGLAKRLEAIEVVLVEKNGAAPGETENCFINGNKVLWGIDVSAWEGDIDWKKVKEDGCDFAMIRITSYNKGGDFELKEDPYFRKNVQGCIENNIPFGGYIYIYADTPEGVKKEAEFGLSLAEGVPFTWPIAFDLEEPDTMEIDKRALNLSLMRSFCETIKDAGFKTMVYGSPSKLNKYFGIDTVASEYEIWLARYRWGYDEMVFADPETRKEVEETGYIGGNYTHLPNVTIWQYSSSGTVSGINGKVDLNIAYKKY